MPAQKRSLVRLRPGWLLCSSLLREQSRTAFRRGRRAVGKRRRLNKRIDAPHVRLYRWLLDSPAYLSLSCPARAVLVEIVRCYDGFNNGRIGLSVRKAAERCRIAPGTAKRAFEELQDRGFIVCVTKGAFSRKTLHATEWRLTFWRCDVTGELPTKAFMSWGREKQNTVLRYSPTVPIHAHPQLQKSA